MRVLLKLGRSSLHTVNRSTEASIIWSRKRPQAASFRYCP